MGLALVLAVVAAAFFAPQAHSLWTKQTALHQLRIGAISEARRCLQRAAWSSPEDGTVDMMAAFCFRQLRQVDRWQDALREAERKEVSPARIERERQLYRIQTGGWREGEESQLAELAGEGVTAYDVPAAFVLGCLANGRHSLAQQIFDAWSVDYPADPHVAYMRGKYWESLGDIEQAREEYATAISREPRHELAHLALAEMFENNDQLRQALRQYAALGTVSPASDAAAVGAARILRKLGQLDRAEAILEPIAGRADAPPEAVADMGRIALDRGELAGAERWFQRAGVEQSRDPRLLVSAIQLLGLQGKPAEAERYFQRVAALGDRVTRIRDLRIRLTADPGDTSAAAEVRRLTQELQTEMSSREPLPNGLAAREEESSPGRRLFKLHCSACHGAEGDGNGLAARHLFPPPRDLRWETARLVSTPGGAPTLDDTVTMLRRGIAGTSMPSYSDLDGDELRQLAEEVHRLRREGLHERLVDVLNSQGEDIYEEDVRESVEILTSPGDPIAVPVIGPATPSSLAAGKKAYFDQGCGSCHGKDGAGVADQSWYDERGFPVRARDLVYEPFKGGQEKEQVYLRIAAGMPGSPHPSSAALSPEATTDLVQFCLSLSRQPKMVLTDHQRAALADGRAYLNYLARFRQRNNNGVALLGVECVIHPE